MFSYDITAASGDYQYTHFDMSLVFLVGSGQQEMLYSSRSKAAAAILLHSKSPISW